MKMQKIANSMLMREIEDARMQLDTAIETNKAADITYSYSVKLDKLIEEYIRRHTVCPRRVGEVTKDIR